MANRLREQLHRFYVQALNLCPAADEPWLWSLLELAPTPQAAHGLRIKRVERLLREHRIRRVSAEQVLAALRAPALQVAPGVVEATTEHIGLLLPRLRLVHTHLRAEPLSRDDLIDLAKLRLDLIAAIGMTQSGQAGQLLVAHLLPPNPEERLWRELQPEPVHHQTLRCDELIRAIEDEYQKSAAATATVVTNQTPDPQVVFTRTSSFGTA